MGVGIAMPLLASRNCEPMGLPLLRREQPMPLIEMARYRRSAVEEHEMAKAAVSCEAAAIHEWLALKYERLADQCQAAALTPNKPLPFPSVQ